jgi:hypothetical protein
MQFSTHSFQIPVDDFLAMEILNTSCDIKCLDKDKATMTDGIPDIMEPSYQKNTIGGICIGSHTILGQEFYYVPMLHPGRHKAKSGFQGILQKVDTIEG